MIAHTSKTAWLDQPGALTFREEPIDALGPTEALCETIVSLSLIHI